MTSDHLPSVLLHPRGSLSMERALKQIKLLLVEHCEIDSSRVDDMLNASIDDIDSMLEKIK